MRNGCRKKEKWMSKERRNGCRKKGEIDVERKEKWMSKEWRNRCRKKGETDVKESRNGSETKEKRCEMKEK